jgi:hypothetical protein
VATVLVDPAVLGEFELDLMTNDFRVWDVAQTPLFVDPGRLAFQLRRSLCEANQNAWSDAADWTLVWITFGESWRDGDEPIPWSSHSALWDKLAEYHPHVRYHLGLGGIPHLSVPQEEDRHAVGESRGDADAY